MRTSVLAAVGTFALLSSCAPVPGGDGAGMTSQTARQCFGTHQVDNFRQGGLDQLFLRVRRDDVYELNGAGGCPDVDFAMRLSLLPDGTASDSRLCTGDYARVVVPGTSSRTSICRVRVSRKLTADEVAALPAGHRP